MATPSPTSEQAAKAAVSSKQEPSESCLSSINLQDQPQVLLLHTPQPQPSTPSVDQMMVPLAMNAQGAIVQNTAAGAGAAGQGISSAQLYVPYILQDNGTMVPLGRLGAGTGLTVDASNLTLPEGVIHPSGPHSSSSDDSNDNHVDIDVDGVVEEEAVTSSSALPSSASSVRHRVSGRSALDGTNGGSSGGAPDKKDKVSNWVVEPVPFCNDFCKALSNPIENLIVERMKRTQKEFSSKFIVAASIKIFDFQFRVHIKQGLLFVYVITSLLIIILAGIRE